MTLRDKMLWQPGDRTPWRVRVTLKVREFLIIHGRVPWWVFDPGAFKRSYKRNRDPSQFGRRDSRVDALMAAIWVITGWNWARRILEAEDASLREIQGLQIDRRAEWERAEEAEAKIEEWKTRCRKLTDPEYGSWRENLNEARAALEERDGQEQT